VITRRRPTADTPYEHEPASATLSDHISDNVDDVVALHRRETDALSPAQRRLERVGRFVGRPTYLVGVLLTATLWVIFNITAPYIGFRPFDKPPFAWLDLLLTFVALVTTTVVVSGQNRQSKLEQQHAHVDLQVNLLTEQKVSKLIHLLEELRRDLPMVRDRHDPQANALQERADTAKVLSALESVGLTSDSVEEISGKSERAAGNSPR
jgi:uncharacterized membrane protein